jgi:hypothetical protein
MNYQITDDSLKIIIKNKDSNIDFSSPVVLKIKNCVEELITSLKDNDYDWKKNNNQLIFNLVSESLKLINRYKKLKLEERKDICFKLIEKLIEKEVNKLQLDTESKDMVTLGIDTIVEPIIELALLSLLKKIKLTESCLKCLS